MSVAGGVGQLHAAIHLDLVCAATNPTLRPLSQDVAARKTNVLVARRL